ncbi:MAG: hypothetical protein LAT67_13770 [Balneolales bacterium]|nr:hypothetical protein [Balneolales bacterium]
MKEITPHQDNFQLLHVMISGSLHPDRLEKKTRDLLADFGRSLPANLVVLSKRLGELFNLNIEITTEVNDYGTEYVTGTAYDNCNGFLLPLCAISNAYCYLINRQKKQLWLYWKSLLENVKQPSTQYHVHILTENLLCILAKTEKELEAYSGNRAHAPELYGEIPENTPLSLRRLSIVEYVLRKLRLELVLLLRSMHYSILGEKTKNLPDWLRNRIPSPDKVHRLYLNMPPPESFPEYDMEKELGNRERSSCQEESCSHNYISLKKALKLFNQKTGMDENMSGFKQMLNSKDIDVLQKNRQSISIKECDVLRVINSFINNHLTKV